MKELNSEDFDKVLKTSIHLRDCPHCGHSAEIRISLPVYGRTGARVECPNCKCQTAYQGITECFFESGGKKRMGTPATPESMMLGILEAVRLWNGREKGGEEE